MHMERFTMIVVAIFLVYLISPTATRSEFGMYSFTAVLPKEKVINFEQDIQEKSQGILAYGGALLYAFNMTEKNLTTNTVSFNITWRQIFLKQYGTPVDVGKLAIDIHGYMIRYGFIPSKFRLNGPPAPPVSLGTEDRTKHSMTVTWEHPKYFDIDSYHIEMRNGTGNASWENVTTVDGTKKSFQLENLEKATGYEIRMDSSNRYGRGELKSKILSVRTKEDDEGGPSSSTVTIVVVVVVIVVTLLILTLITGFYWRRKQNIMAAKKFNPYEDSLPGILPINIYIQDNRTYCTTGATDESSDGTFYFSWNEIPRDHIAMGDVLGEGEFGMVQKATWTDEETECDIAVAVKTVKDIATSDDRRELFKELKLMAELEQHPHVVNLIGACSHRGPLWVVVEFCENGNLLHHIKKHREELAGNDQPFISSLDQSTRLKFAYDVSKGMKYLEGKKIIHRDLAARNVLLGENNIAKVSDFGLSRDIYETGLYQKTTGGKLPVKWMAVESLQEATYTSKSDAWSFGILYWEIETAGMVPYGGIPGLELLEHLQRGYRLPKPSITKPEVYTLMASCWQLDPDCRPSFKDIEATLGTLMEDTFNYLEVVNEEDTKRAASYDNFIAPTEND